MKIKIILVLLTFFAAQIYSQTLTVTLRNVTGTSTPLPGANGTVVLYASSTIEAKTNSNGVATFNNVPYGSYFIEGYHSPNPPTIFGTEFWGGMSINFNSSNTSFILDRNMPYDDLVKVYNDATGQSVTGGNVVSGTTLRFEVKINNPNKDPKTVRTRLVVDRDKQSSSSYDYDKTLPISGVTVSGNGTTTIVLSEKFTPTATGDYFQASSTQTNIENNWTVTNGSLWSTSKLFTVIPPPPPAPTLKSPTDGSTGISMSPTLSWNASSGATSYELQVSTSSSFSSTVYDQSNITNTSSTVGPLSSNTQYYWRVNATNSGGTSSWSSTWRFTTIAPPPAPTAYEATNVSNYGFTANWSSVSGATGYRLDVSTNSSFSSLVSGYNNKSVSGTSYNVSGLNPGAYYYYRVRAENAGGSSPSSNPPITVQTIGMGTLSVTLMNVNGTPTPLPGANGEVYLYDQNYNLITSQKTNSSGVATFTDRSYGSYKLEGYHTPSNPSTIFGTEFWGGMSINFNSSNTSFNLVRNMPYNYEISVYNDATGQAVTGESVISGTTVRFEVKIQNPNINAQSVKARLVVDKDKQASPSYDYDEIYPASGTSVSGNNGTVTLVFSSKFTVTETGDYYGVAGTQTYVGSAWSVTNGDPWPANKLFSVIANTGNINVTFKDRNGQTVGSGNEIKRYSNTSPWQYLDTKQTNSSGTAAWTNINGGVYNFEGYNNLHYDIWGENSYWGTSQGTVTGNSTAYTEIRQDQPVIENIMINGSSFIPGSKVYIEVQVRNIASSGSEECQAEIRIDHNKASPWDYPSGFHGPVTIQAGQLGYFGFEWIVPSNASTGAYYVTARVQTKKYSGYLTTDTKGWDNSFIIEETISTIEFSKIKWNVTSGVQNPGNNHWSNGVNSIWKDEQDNLHMKIRKIGDQWYCAQLFAQESFGYGEYIFYVSTNIDKFDKNIVLGLLTYETDEKEIDIEFSQFNDASLQPGWYIVRPPSDESKRNFSLNLRGDYSTHKFRWSPNEIFFQSYHGHYEQLPSDENLIKEWPYVGPNIPPVGNERLVINFWLYNNTDLKDQQEAEVIIKAVKINPVSNLQVQIKNIDGSTSPVPGENGIVKLYDLNGVQVGTDQKTNSQGVATFSNVPSGNLYDYQVFHNPNSPQTIFGQEYWGGNNGITISAGSNYSEFLRSEPFAYEYKVFNNLTNTDITGGIIEVGTPLRIEVKIKNPNSATIHAKARLVLDKDKILPYDFDNNPSSGIDIMGNNGIETFTFLYTPREAGDYFGVVGTQSYMNDGYTITDGWAWSDTKWMTVVVPLSRHLEIPYVFQGSSSWCWAAACSMILQGYGYHEEIWEIASNDYFNAPKNKGKNVDEVADYLNTNFNASQNYPWKVEEYNPDDILKGRLINLITNAHPVFFGKTGDFEIGAHAIVITGVDEQNVYLHDPSGYLFMTPSEDGKVDENLVNEKIPWTTFMEKLKTWLPWKNIEILFTEDEHFNICSNKIGLQVVSLRQFTSGYEFSQIEFRNSFNSTDERILNYDWDGQEPYIGYKYVTSSDWYNENPNYGYNSSVADLLKLMVNRYNYSYPLEPIEGVTTAKIINSYSKVLFSFSTELIKIDRTMSYNCELAKFDMNLLDPGTYKLRFELKDNAGNLKDYTEYNFTVDPSPTGYASFQIEYNSPVFQEIPQGGVGIWKMNVKNRGTASDFVIFYPEGNYVPQYFINGSQVDRTPELAPGESIVVELRFRTDNQPISTQTHDIVSHFISNNDVIKNYKLKCQFKVIPPLIVNVKVFLQGPYYNGDMKTDLKNNGLISPSQPFNLSPWNYQGTESVESIPNDIVDWVLVELRSGLTSETKIASRAGFLKSDGTIVDLDGTSPLKFTGIDEGSYYQVVIHRNHLAVMSSNPIQINAQSEKYDFTTGADKAYGINSMIKLADGIYGLWAGDTDASGVIDSQDRSNTWNSRNQSGVYSNTDTDLSGVIDSQDRSNTWNNRNSVTNVP